MEIILSENIRKFRKERRLTQEGLAELLGVTTGAVYKWESGLSVPELSLIVQMADFFDTSVDVLLGYKMKDNHIDAIISRVNEYCRTLDPEGPIEAEKALKKYPNSFEIVFGSATIYLIYGMASHDENKLLRSLDLFEHALQLISQNRHPQISELSIYSGMADAYLALGNYTKGVELYKQHNANGIFSDMIAVGLSVFLNSQAEAEPYLADSFVHACSMLFNSIIAYVFYYRNKGDYQSAQSILNWSLNIMNGLKKSKDPDFLDKLYSENVVLLAYIKSRTGEKEEAHALLEEAASVVRSFDNAPDYGITTLRYVSDVENASIHDMLGASAKESIDTLLGFLNDEEFLKMWKEVCENA